MDFVELPTCLEAAVLGQALSHYRLGSSLTRKGDKWRLRIDRDLPDHIFNAFLNIIKEDKEKNQEVWNQAAKSMEDVEFWVDECETPEEMRAVAEDMKNSALQRETHKCEYAGSSTEFEAHMKAEDMRKKMLEENGLRFIFFGGKVMNCVLTLQEMEGKRTWNFSTSTPMKPPLNQPGRVPDEIVNVLVPAFLGEKYEEVEPKAVWNTVRHFVAEAS